MNPQGNADQLRSSSALVGGTTNKTLIGLCGGKGARTRFSGTVFQPIRLART